MIGLHIIADFKGVNFEKINLDKNILKKFISKNLKNFGLSELGNHYHTFSKKDEITCVVALSESHINIHTWPEKKYVSLDIFVCNFGVNNSEKAKKIYKNLIDFFSPEKIEEKFLERKS